MTKQLFTEKYEPHIIKNYVGFSHNAVLLYIKRTLEGTEKKKGFIMWGDPGTGKSTLANLLSSHFNISQYYTNASDERRKKDVNTDIFRTESLKNKNILIIFDEVDGLPKSSFQELEKALKKYKHPIILIANNLEKIPYSIRKLCAVEKFVVDKFSLLALAKKVSKSESLDLSREDVKKIVDQSDSFRDVLHALQFGMGTNLPKQLSPNTTVLYSLQGQSVDLPKDMNDLIIRFNDNSNSPNLISMADLWNRRYVSGYTYGKQIVWAILGSIRSPNIKKLEYPRTYKLIHEAKTGKKKRIDPTSGKKSKAPKIKIIGFK